VCGYRSDVINTKIPLDVVPENIPLKILTYNSRKHRIDSAIHKSGTG
jgi:hypothetical protein